MLFRGIGQIGRRVVAQTLPTRTQLQVSRGFHASRALRDWHQKYDPKTGEFYYYNIFTEETTKIQPNEYLPYDAKQESPLMKFFRTDSFAPTSGKGPSWRYWTAFACIVGCLLIYDHLNPPAQLDAKGRPIKVLSAQEQEVEDEVQRRLDSYKRQMIEQRQNKS